MFWYDKAIGYTYNYSYTGNDSEIKITGLTVSMTVSKDYSAIGKTETYKTSLTQITQAKQSMIAAQNIVAKYSNLSDIAFLLQFQKKMIHQMMKK